MPLAWRSNWPQQVLTDYNLRIAFFQLLKFDLCQSQEKVMPKIKDSEWTKELYYHDTPLKDRDQIYLKCYKNGEAGYVGQYQELHPSETIVTIMNGISTSRKTEDKTVRYAVWVPEAKKDSDAFQFIVHRDGDNGEKVWLEADIVGGHQAVVSVMQTITVHPQREN